MGSAAALLLSLVALAIFANQVVVSAAAQGYSRHGLPSRRHLLQDPTGAVLGAASLLPGAAATQGSNVNLGEASGTEAFGEAQGSTWFICCLCSHINAAVSEWVCRPGNRLHYKGLLLASSCNRQPLHVLFCDPWPVFCSGPVRLHTMLCRKPACVIEF